MATSLWGCVNKDGSVHSGTGFNVDKVGTGNYVITYADQFSTPPAVVLTQNFKSWEDFGYQGGSLTDNAVLIAGDASHCKVLTGAAKNHEDRNFTFIAMGT